jgi:hypothetical protein
MSGLYETILFGGFMKKILWTAVAVLSSALISARASEITIYPSFAEVRDSVQVSGNHFDWSPAADLGQFLIPGSLELNDPSVTSLNLLAAPESLLALFEGKEVKVWFHEKFVVATVVKADAFLFQIDGAFVQLSGAEVLYPSLDGMTYAPTFSWQRTGGTTKAQLRYATTAVAWENTRYTLNLPDDSSPESNSSSLLAWADISNQSSVVYDAPKTTLFAGDVLPQYDQRNFQQSQNRNINSFANDTRDANANQSRVASSGEVGGLQRYEYPQPLHLGAKSRLSLPFIRNSVAVRRILEYSGEFNPGANFKVGLQRTYRFIAKQGLPTGIVTVRENEQLVGQTSIDDTAKETIVKVNLGKDFDIKINRSAKILEDTARITRARVVLTITNTKSRAINVRLVETIDDRIKLEGSGVVGFKRLPGAFTLESEISAGKTLTLTLLSTDKR